MYLLDTNIIVFLLRGRQDIARQIDLVGLQNCAISEITKAELLMGFYKAQMLGHAPDSRVLDFLDSIAVVPISSSLDFYARELARLQLEGRPIDDFDLLIAATAVTCGMILVTDNVTHMSRVRDLTVRNFVSK